jgi:lactate permease
VIGVGWIQNYQPVGPLWVSAVLAALPVLVLLVTLGMLRRSAHFSAGLALAAALLVALLIYRMPADLAFDAAAFGVAFGIWNVIWIAFHAVFFHNVTVATGRFDAVRSALAGFSPDRRLQALLIAFAFGALLEGIAGGGAPVAITGAMLFALGFPPVKAVVLALLANTAPVAFGGLGNPLIILGRLTGPILKISPDQATNLFSAMVGRQLPLISVIIPGFLVVVLAGWKKMTEVWPAVLTAGLSFAIVQFLVSNYVTPSLVDVLAALTAMLALWVLSRFWQPKSLWDFDGGTPRESATVDSPGAATPARSALYGWAPYIILIVVILLSRIGTIFKNLPGWLDLTKTLQKPNIKFNWPGLHNEVIQHSPITPKNTPYAATFTIDWLFSAGSMALIAAVIAGLTMGANLRRLAKVYWDTIVQMRWAHDHELLRRHADPWPGTGHHRRGVPAVLRVYRVVWRVPHRFGRVHQHAVRPDAGDFRAAAAHRPDPGRRHQYVGWRDGQDDLTAEPVHRRHRDRSHRQGIHAAARDFRVVAAAHRGGRRDLLAPGPGSHLDDPPLAITRRLVMRQPAACREIVSS